MIIVMKPKEYIIAAGNTQVILCEQGIRSFDNQYPRNILDLLVILVLRTLTHLLIVLGADALMIEVHHDPSNLRSIKN